MLDFQKIAEEAYVDELEKISMSTKGGNRLLKELQLLSKYKSPAGNFEGVSGGADDVAAEIFAANKGRQAKRLENALLKRKKSFGLTSQGKRIAGIAGIGLGAGGLGAGGMYLANRD